jgi:hypothetical protein
MNALLSTLLMASVVSGSAPPANDPVQMLRLAAEAVGLAHGRVSSLRIRGTLRRPSGAYDATGTFDILLSPPGRMRKAEQLRFGDMDMRETWLLDPSGARSANGDLPEGGRRMLEGQLRRFWLAFVLDPLGATIQYGGRAVAPDGEADVIGFEAADGSAVRLFVETKSRRPLMLSYRGVPPRYVGTMTKGSTREEAEAKSRAEQQRRAAEPPTAAEIQVRLGEYKKFDGVEWPCLVSTSANGAVLEELTVEKVEVNPKVGVHSFQKP